MLFLVTASVAVASGHLLQSTFGLLIRRVPEDDEQIGEDECS